MTTRPIQYIQTTGAVDCLGPANGDRRFWVVQAPLRDYRIRCAGLEYITKAASTCMAVADAIALHGLRAVSVSPLQLRKGGAA